MVVDTGCLTSSGTYRICDHTYEQCCDGFGCVAYEGQCCGPSAYYNYFVRQYSDHCGPDERCCANSYSALCCAAHEHCCSSRDNIISCCNYDTPKRHLFYTKNGEWWMWTMFIMVVLLFVAIVFISCFDESGFAYRQTQRLRNWYHDRFNRVEEEDDIEDLTAYIYQLENNPAPPLYQTNVSPTYRYQKPPTPHEPPPSYDDLANLPSSSSWGIGTEQGMGGGVVNARNHYGGAVPAGYDAVDNSDTCSTSSYSTCEVDDRSSGEDEVTSGKEEEDESESDTDREDGAVGREETSSGSAPRVSKLHISPHLREPSTDLTTEAGIGPYKGTEMQETVPDSISAIEEVEMLVYEMRTINADR